MSAVINRTESGASPEREVISLLVVRKVGDREVVEAVPTYTAVGFAHARVERMLNPGRDARGRRFA